MESQSLHAVTKNKIIIKKKNNLVKRGQLVYSILSYLSCH